MEYNIEFKSIEEGRGIHVILHGEDYTVQAILLVDEHGIGLAPLSGAAFASSSAPIFSYVTTTRDRMDNTLEFCKDIASVVAAHGQNMVTDVGDSVDKFLDNEYKGGK